MREPPSGSAERLIFLLKLIAEADHAMKLSEIAELSAMPISSAHRLLRVLLKANILERREHNSYHAGMEYFRISNNLLRKFDLAQSARPLLQELVDTWNETAVLCAFSPVRRNAVVADRVQTSHSLRFGIEIGRAIDLPWGSLGRAILAHVPHGVVHAILRDCPIGPLSGKPRLSIAEMDETLAQVRACGFADYHNPELDLAGIASPVFGIEGKVVGSIGVTMPSTRYQIDAQEELGRSVRRCGQVLSSLGSPSSKASDEVNISV